MYPHVRTLAATLAIPNVDRRECVIASVSSITRQDEIAVQIYFHWERNESVISPDTGSNSPLRIAKPLSAGLGPTQGIVRWSRNAPYLDESRQRPVASKNAAALSAVDNIAAFRGHFATSNVELECDINFHRVRQINQENNLRGAHRQQIFGDF